MKRVYTNNQIEERARAYGVCNRTIHRWIEKAIDVFDANCVAAYLAQNPAATSASLDAVIRQLQRNPQ